MRLSNAVIATVLISFAATSHAQPDDQDNQQEQSRITTAYVTTGDPQALKSDCYKLGNASTCINTAFLARVAALKAKKVTPKTCREFGLANEYFFNGSVPMSVGLAPSKLVGLFQGEVTEIEGRSVAVYNSNTQQNAVINISKSMLVGAENIVVGSFVLGYGVQTGVSKGRTANGSPVSMALISANCLGLAD